MINNMSYRDYAEKYLGLNNWTEEGQKSFDEKASLYVLSGYLSKNNNYKIYHALDDYFVNRVQISKLKDFAGANLICLNCGSHLGFLYRKEFENEIKKAVR